MPSCHGACPLSQQYQTDLFQKSPYLEVRQMVIWSQPEGISPKHSTEYCPQCPSRLDAVERTCSHEAPLIHAKGRVYTGLPLRQATADPELRDCGRKAII